MNRGKKLNWRQACEILQCTKSRFYRLVASGVLPSYQLKGSKRGIWVYENDVLACVETKCHAKETE